MIHRKTSNLKPLEFRGKEGWSIGADLDNYLCQCIIPHNTKAEKISNMVEFQHQAINTPVVTVEDRILHGITTLTDSLTDAPIAQSDAQIQVITALRDAFASCTSPDETPDQLPFSGTAQTRQFIIFQKRILKHTRLQQPVPPPPPANSKGT